MKKPIRVTVAMFDYDRTFALRSGKIRPEGIELNFLKLRWEEIFWRMLRHQEFDASEMSLSSLVLARSMGIDDFVGLPIFPSRLFRHSCIYINPRSGIREPKDLIGKKVGVPEYQVTAALWARAALHHEYGVKASDLQWFTGGTEQPGRVEKIQLHLPQEIQVQPVGSGKALEPMLEEGELDALISGLVPRSILRRDGKVVRLFPDFAEKEKEYYRKTGLLPIMHTFVVRKKLIEEYPWAARSLYKAFVDAKAYAYQNLRQRDRLLTSIPWMEHCVDEITELMGEDFWPYGIEKNRRVLESVIQFSQEQGIIQRKLGVEELYPIPVE